MRLNAFITAITAMFGTFITATQASALTCRAKVALNRIYDASVDEATGYMEVTNDAGTTMTGNANRYVSGRTGDITWFLATGFNSGVEIQKENGGANRIALCLADNECYLCR
jgi:hypothetical protein